MPPGRPPAVPNIEPSEAKRILEGLIRDRRIDASAIHEYRQKIQDEISALVDRLRSLGWSGAAAGAAGVAAAGAAIYAGAAAVKAVKKRGSRSSAEQDAVRKLQGRYLGLSRNIPAARMKEFKEQIPVVGKETVVQAMADFVEEQKGGSKPGRRSKRKRARR
jgi:hypothetical protein